MRNSCILYVLLLLLLFCLIIPVNALAIEGFPGSTWGELYWEVPKKGAQQDLVLQGWVEQGATLKRWGDVYLNTYATLRYNWDSQEFDWNNKLSPGVGVALEILSIKQFHMRAGVEYLWERHFETGHEQQKVWFYTDWYGWWNLGKKY